MLTELRRLYRRELTTLEEAIRAYPDEDSLWRTTGSIQNSGGSLGLHLCGNLQHFVGALLGGSAYVRDRDAEFSRRDVTRTELAELVRQTREVVDRALAGLEEERLAEPFPVEFPSGPLTTQMFLMHLVSHLSYHLGQLDYHRRMASDKAPAVPALQFSGLYDSME